MFECNVTRGMQTFLIIWLLGIGCVLYLALLEPESLCAPPSASYVIPWRRPAMAFRGRPHAVGDDGIQAAVSTATMNFRTHPDETAFVLLLMNVFLWVLYAPG